MTNSPAYSHQVSGEFIDFAGERYYVIRNTDVMPPFFMSLVSNSDHWLFISSTGGLTAGRVSPDTALFPYITVDKIHESAPHTGSKTSMVVTTDSEAVRWEPFNRAYDGVFHTNRNLYKSLLGNKLCFEEINHDLQLVYRYTWLTSDEYGFVRQCELENFGGQNRKIELLDGLQNILPAGTPRFAQTNTSNLVDAYKWAELDQSTGLAFYTLFSGITDRAEPCESLKANTVFCLGLEDRKILLSSEQLNSFRTGEGVHEETTMRGTRGAFLVTSKLELPAKSSRQWKLVTNLEQSQADAVELAKKLANPEKLAESITQSVEEGSDQLARIMANSDGYQTTAEEAVSGHHLANVIFNVLRGGIFEDQYNVPAEDFISSIKHFNVDVFARNRDFLQELPETLDIMNLRAAVAQQNDSQLERLCSEYLPITFGRRHGDPSRPWNQFELKFRDEMGKPLLAYQGNWRDIFQNWEALTLSYPEFTESIIAKFVNASTIDGHNPYRITKEGIDWEVEEPDDPWSYIGYWGDHQIIYLLKILELSSQFHPVGLGELLHKPIYCYANVPYHIKSFEEIVENAKSTVIYDEESAAVIERRVAVMGADGKLLLDQNGSVYQVNLIEKLLVPLLCKLGNLVIDGGIWLNTQRPEWNDANNAIVGQGLSMVTLYYVRRYISFLQEILSDETVVSLSTEISQWLLETADILSEVRPQLGAGPIPGGQRYKTLQKLGRAASDYRQNIYQKGAFAGDTSQVGMSQILGLLEDALAAVDHSIANNQRDDGLYHAYNLLKIENDEVIVDNLYPMLEGQVAALSAGVITPESAVQILEALFESDVYRPDQKTFLLYPDRSSLPRFLEKNRVPADDVASSPLLLEMIQVDDRRIIERDADGCYRFNSDFTNVGDLNTQLDTLTTEYAGLEAAREPIKVIYEKVFKHQAFTGRSGGMFGFEGLGCIYWHMVSKLLLAVEENFFSALDKGTDSETLQQLGELYYRVREGIGFNKTPEDYGAFPIDPYSHTPKYGGARQPGMTGQVKEEMVTRHAELGIRVKEGAVQFQPSLLRAREFVEQSKTLRYLDVNGRWHELAVPVAGLAFTWCQVPVIYQLDDQSEPSITVTHKDGSSQTLDELRLPAEMSKELFLRSGCITQLTLKIRSDQLFNDKQPV